MKDKSNSFDGAWQAFCNSLGAAYGLAPAAVIICLILASILIIISLYFVEIMIGSIIILVIFISMIVYAASNNYGEATLALMAGLFAAFTVDWTWNKYVVFLSALIIFSSFILLTWSIRLAAKSESVYLQAAIYIDVANSKEVEKQLRKLADETSTRKLGPFDKADSILIMAFRKIPMESMKYMLDTVDLISGITSLDAKSVTLFLIELQKTLKIPLGPGFQYEIDRIFTIYRDAPISYDEFIRAFRNSKNLVTSGRIDPLNYLIHLKSGLLKGISPEEITGFIQDEISVH